MDDSTIIALFAQQKEDITEIVQLNSTSVRGKIESEVNRIDEMDQLRNGRITDAECDITDIRNETCLFRWAHRNPGKAIASFLILFCGLAYGYHKIDIKRTIENKSGVYFKDSTTDTAERGPIDDQ